MLGLSSLAYKPIFSYGTLYDSEPVEVSTEVTTVVVLNVIKSVVVPTEVLPVGSNVVVFRVVVS